MNEYWFKPKRYGYGATPVTWEGWALTAAAVIVIFLASWLVSMFGRADPALWFVWTAVIGATVIGLWIVSRRKTDGVWRWRWGSDH
jgi:hypothetical protein